MQLKKKRCILKAKSLSGASRLALDFIPLLVSLLCFAFFFSRQLLA